MALAGCNTPPTFRKNLLNLTLWGFWFFPLLEIIIFSINIRIFASLFL